MDFLTTAVNRWRFAVTLVLTVCLAATAGADKPAFLMAHSAGLSFSYYDKFWAFGDSCCGGKPLRVLNTTANGQDAQSGSGRQSCCGGQTAYDPEKRVCCWRNVKGYYLLDIPKIFRNTSRDTWSGAQGSSGSLSGLQCCGTQIYDASKAVCCDETVRIVSKRVSLFNSACCGKDVYDPFAEICCSGQVHKRTTLSTECCGSTVYDTADAVCCNGTLNHLSKDGGRKTGRRDDDEVEEVVREGAVFDEDDVGPNSQCCGTNAYNSAKQICCDGSLNSRQSKTASCCGREQFDFTSHLCCEGRVIERNQSTSYCCGSHSYDVTSQICCKGNVFLINSFQVMCCGDSSYNVSSQICCDSAIFERSSPSTSCCGRQTYDLLTGVCCDNHVIQRQQADEQQAKSLAFQSVLSRRWDWFQYVRSDMSATECCGRKPYDPLKEVCCEGDVVSKNGNRRLFCCGKKTYDPRKESCCSGESFPREE